MKVEVTQPDGSSETPALAEIEAEALQPTEEPEEVTETAEEVVVQIGEEPTEEEPRAPDWVRDLRKQHRELQRKNRELEERLQVQTPQVTLGKKPTLDDFDYDAEKFEKALESWYDKKKHIDSLQQRARQAEEEQAKSWQEKLENYASAKTSLRVKDYEDAEMVAQESLNTVQQGVILQGSENPALVVYAIGKNPKKAKELASITDPVKFAFAIAKLESQLKVQPKRVPPSPDRPISGNAPSSGTVDSNLDRLRAEAERTGDYSKVVRYKQQLRSKAK